MIAMLAQQEDNAEFGDEDDDELSFASSTSNVSLYDESSGSTPRRPQPKQISRLHPQQHLEPKQPDIIRNKGMYSDEENELLSDANYLMSRKEQLKEQLKGEEARSKSVRIRLTHLDIHQDNIDDNIKDGRGDRGLLRLGSACTVDTECNTDGDSEGNPRHAITMVELPNQTVEIMEPSLPTPVTSAPTVGSAKSVSFLTMKRQFGTEECNSLSSDDNSLDSFTEEKPRRSAVITPVIAVSLRTMKRQFSNGYRHGIHCGNSDDNGVDPLVEENPRQSAVTKPVAAIRTMGISKRTIGNPKRTMGSPKRVSFRTMKSDDKSVDSFVEEKPQQSAVTTPVTAGPTIESARARSLRTMKRQYSNGFVHGIHCGNTENCNSQSSDDESLDPFAQESGGYF